MIEFVSVEYKNFLSAGANSIKIDLNRAKSTLIVGHNGAGKSSILDALSFGLFGKPHRSVSKAQLINSVNLKGAEVDVQFKVAGHSFEVKRGIKPNKFEIWQDGSMIDQTSNARDYQKFLEQNILKLNHKSFHQIVVLGSSSFIPFMQLPTNHRREVIEDLLDINIFSKMKTIIKERSSSIRNLAKEEKSSLDVYKGKFDYQEKYIMKMESLNKEAEEDVESTNKVIDVQIASLTKEGIDLNDSLSSYASNAQEQLAELQEVRDNLRSQMTEVKVAIEHTTEEHMFYMNNDSCPTCTQDITQELKDDRVATIKDGAKILLKARTEVTDEQEENRLYIEAIQADLKEIALIGNTMSKIQSQIEQLKASKRKIVDAVDLASAYAELKELQTKSDECRDQLDEYNEKMLYNGVASEMLKDTGIRTKVVKEYLPAMNMLINQYLQTLDFFVSFNLDESFNETIRSRHRDTFVYANFSEGEKQRIDLALLFAWRKIAQMKNSTNTNLLILDETFDSSLDTDGVDNLMKILYHLDDNTNTFVISHKPDLLESKLDKKITFKKPNNFSMIA